MHHTREDYILASSRTAIARKKPSVPMRYLESKGVLKGDLLDYGCGRGFDCEHFGAVGFDPVHLDDFVNMTAVDNGAQYDVVFCNYVLNTLPEYFEGEIVEEIKGLLKPGGQAFISVRRDKFTEGWNKRGTFQRTVKLDAESFKKTSSYEIYRITK